MPATPSHHRSQEPTCCSVFSRQRDSLTKLMQNVHRISSQRNYITGDSVFDHWTIQHLLADHGSFGQALTFHASPRLLFDLSIMLAKRAVSLQRTSSIAQSCLRMEVLQAASMTQCYFSCSISIYYIRCYATSMCAMFVAAFDYTDVGLNIRCRKNMAHNAILSAEPLEAALPASPG